MGSEDLIKQNQPKWHYVYYLLAGIDILTVVISLVMNHHLANEYKIVVESNQQWTALHEYVDAMSVLVSEINAPGNDIFDSKNVRFEKTRAKTAYLVFQSKKEDFLYELSLLKQDEYRTQLFQLTDHLETQVSKMKIETEAIFSFFEKKQFALAGNRMASMDRSFAEVRMALADISKRMRYFQQQELSIEAEQSQWMKKIEFAFAGFVFLLVMGITLYGQKMSRFVKDSQSQIESQQIALVQSAKMSSLGMMAAGIAHEINNPLAVVQGKSSVLRRRIERDKFEKAQAIEELQKIEAMAIRIGKIVHGLKTFSRSGEKDPLVETSIKTIIEESIELCGERLKAHDVELRLKNIIDINVDCRATQISQIIVNLIGNAHDEIVGKYEQKWIEVEVKETSDQVQVLVTDCGGGIPPNIAAKLMQPFFTTKELGKGTGLGLSISKSIAQDHGGDLILNSAHPHTQFQLILPKPKKQIQPLNQQIA